MNLNFTCYNLKEGKTVHENKKKREEEREAYIYFG
jgi:hypothetical protein